MANITKDEFITQYCERSRIPWDELSKFFVALPCACGDETCEGWAMVRNAPYDIGVHESLYGSRDAGVGEQE